MLRPSTAQVLQDSHFSASLFQVTRTREVIDRVEIQHEALGSEAPVTTVAEQRSTRRTTMERGGAKRTAALPSSQPSGRCASNW